MKQVGTFANYNTVKREKNTQKSSFPLRRICEFLVTINCLNLYYEAKNGKDLK